MRQILAAHSFLMQLSSCWYFPRLYFVSSWGRMQVARLTTCLIVHCPDPPNSMRAWSSPVPRPSVRVHIQCTVIYSGKRYTNFFMLLTPSLLLLSLSDTRRTNSATSASTGKINNNCHTAIASISTLLTLQIHSQNWSQAERKAIYDPWEYH